MPTSCKISYENFASKRLKARRCRHRFDSSQLVFGTYDIESADKCSEFTDRSVLPSEFYLNFSPYKRQCYLNFFINFIILNNLNFFLGLHGTGTGWDVHKRSGAIRRGRSGLDVEIRNAWYSDANVVCYVNL